MGPERLRNAQKPALQKQSSVFQSPAPQMPFRDSLFTTVTEKPRKPQKPRQKKPQAKRAKAPQTNLTTIHIIGDDDLPEPPADAPERSAREKETIFRPVDANTSSHEPPDILPPDMLPPVDQSLNFKQNASTHDVLPPESGPAAPQALLGPEQPSELPPQDASVPSIIGGPNDLGQQPDFSIIPDVP